MLISKAELGIDFRTIIAEGIYIRQAVQMSMAGARFPITSKQSLRIYVCLYLNLFVCRKMRYFNDTSFENGRRTQHA